MAAVITDAFKRNVIELLKDNVESTSETYYIGIGRSQDWDSADNVPNPLNSLKNEHEFRLNLQSVKTAEDISYVVPRNNWTTGTVYSGWDEAVVGQPDLKHYVITDDNQVYVCLESGKNVAGVPVNSSVKPSSVDPEPQRLSDGYVWKYLYTMAIGDSTKYLTSNYFPVKFQDAVDSASTPLEQDQRSIQDAAIDGQIGGITLINGGTGYTSAPSVSIIGNGTGAQATAYVSSGAVVKVEMKDSAGSTDYFPGQDYDYANIVFSGGGGEGAKARPNIAPIGGFGADPRQDLKSTALMFNTKPSGFENEDFIVGQDFRQVGIMKGLKRGNNDSDFTGATGSALTYMTLSSVSVAFTADKIIEGGTTGAKAYVDRFDSDTIYYHQTDSTGFTPFQSAESVSEANGSGVGVIGTPLNNGDINKFKGDVLYIDNRSAVIRADAQTEDIKIIIQF
jgi:hypothetical protein